MQQPYSLPSAASAAAPRLPGLEPAPGSVAPALAKSGAAPAAADSLLPAAVAVLPDDAGPALLDLSALSQIRALELSGACDLMARLLATYITSSAELIAAADAGFAAGDARAVVRALHTLKSSSGNLGARCYAQACAAIENQIRVGELAAARRAWEQQRPMHGAILAALSAQLGPAAALADLDRAARAEPGAS